MRVSFRGEIPLTRIASDDAIRPLPQGERRTVNAEADWVKFTMRLSS
jgi:hypothetical protein